MARSKVVYVVRHEQEIMAVFTVRHEMGIWLMNQQTQDAPFWDEYRAFAIPDGQGEQAAREIRLWI